MGHEVPDHQTGKATIATFWRRRDYIAVCEAGCDVLAWRVKNGELQSMFTEYERSTRNVVRNCQRNQSQVVIGTARFLIVVDHERMRAAVRRQLRRHLSPECSRKIGIALLSRIDQSL
jgi:hypothetical protein